jgi:hypothetical protein
VSEQSGTGHVRLYDVEQALQEIARARLRPDELTRQQVAIADRLVIHLDRHFAAEELETAGRALLVGAASVGVLCVEDMQPQVLVNILAFAGARLVTDGRGYIPEGLRRP